MKKTNKKNVTLNTPGLNRNLIEGAELLVREIKTPAALLDFTTECLWWIENFDKEQDNEPNNGFLRSIIENIVQPWIASGNDATIIAKGLLGVWDSYSEEYERYFSKIVQALGLELKRNGIWPEYDKYFHVIGTLAQILFLMHKYQNSLKKEQDNISNAA